VLFILTVSLRLIFLETYWDNPSSLWDDEYDYVYLSKYINEGGSWISETMPNSRPPLLSIILAPIAEYDPYVMRIYLVCLSSTSTIFLFLLSKILFPRHQTIWSLPSLIWAIYPPAIWYSTLISTESLASLMVLISVFTLIKTLNTNNKTYLSLCGIAIGLLILTRSSYVFIPFFLIGLSIMSTFLFKTKILSARQMVIIFAAVILITSPIIIRNYSTNGSFLPTESRLSYGLLLSNGDFESKKILDGGYDKTTDSMRIYSAAKNDNPNHREIRNMSFDIIVTEIQSHPRSIPIILSNRIVNFWGPRPDPFDINITINDIIMFAVWIPILLCFASSVICKNDLNYKVMLIFIVYAFITTIGFWASPRFRFPVDSLIILSSILGLIRYSEMFQKRAVIV
tara:strand:- start:10866 stop:12059 length:1194 start_codon:yes stop_codon:yes gene_type:complete